MSDLPPGFVLDCPSASSGGLPPGFVLDAPRAPRPVGAAMSVNNPPLKPPPAADQAPSKPWADVPGEALQNLPQSAGNFLSALVQPILHPIDTATALGKVGEGVVSKGRALARGAVGLPTDVDRATVEAPANAVGQFYGDRYGSMEGFKNALATDPVGVAADAATVLSGGAALPGRAGAVAGTISRAIDPVTQSMNALKLGGKGAEVLTSNALGMTTGGGKKSIRTTADAGRGSVAGGAEGVENATTFRENMRGALPDNVFGRAKGALDEIRKEAGAEYRSGMVDISKDRSILDFADINKAIDNAGGIGKFKGANIAPTATEINDKLRTVVREWETLDPASPLFKDVVPGDLTAANFHTPEGLDALKRTIGDIRDSTQYRTPERAAADRVYNAVKNEIVAQAPAYGKIMEGYAKAADNIGEATRTLSLGEKSSKDTAIRKLLSATRDGVQTNYGGRQKLIDMLAEKDSTLPYAIAGQAMNSLVPRGLVARGSGTLAASSLLHNPGNAFLIPAFSPRAVGEVTYYAGKGAGMAERGANALRLTEENLRRGGRASYQAGRQQEAR